MAGSHKVFGVVCLVFQVCFLILFAIFIDYDDSAHANPSSRGGHQAQGGPTADHQKALHDDTDNSLDTSGRNTRSADAGQPVGNGVPNGQNKLWDFYPMFQDVHVMMFIGFGFLMMFLKRYGFSSVGLNLLIGAFVIQWAMLVGAFVHMVHEGHSSATISIENLLTADFAAATIFISFGALLGKTTPLQLIFMAFIEIIVFTINEWVGLSLFKAVDIGGSMFVHVFGAYFGLSASRVLFQDDFRSSSKEGSIYHSDMFAMVGTIFLWMFWPSFNSALGVGDAQQRAVINTYLALGACCLVAFAISSLTEKHGKFDMVHIQNATLAGGVAVGTSADMMIHPWGAILIGMLAATLSVLGYKYLTPLLAARCKLHDTCGVNNLHGMPGLFAGVVGAIVASVASTEVYGNNLYVIFPARAPAANTTAFFELQAAAPGVAEGEGRSAAMQAGYQALALCLTLVVAVASGALTGLLLRIKPFSGPRGKQLYDDALWWEMPDDFDLVAPPGDRLEEKSAKLLVDGENAAEADTNI